MTTSLALQALLKRHRHKITALLFGHVHTKRTGTLTGIPAAASSGNQGGPDLHESAFREVALLGLPYRVGALQDDDMVIHQIPFDHLTPIQEIRVGHPRRAPFCR